MDHADLSLSITLMEPLTDRELDVLRLMIEDLSIAALAEWLYLSTAAVKWYTQQIYGELGIHEPSQKRRQAVARARPSTWTRWSPRMCKRVHECSGL